MSDGEYGERVQVYGVTWDEYLRLVDLFAERHVRLSYDGWTLEMAKSTPCHERRKVLLGGLIDELASAYDVAFSALGGATVHRDDLRRGVDPDLSYYRPGKLRREGRGLLLEGPPDMVAELHITDSSPWRLAILADLGVREVWSFDGRDLLVSIQQDGRFVASDRSPTFPFAPLEALAGSLRDFDQGSDRAWREHIHALASSNPSPREG